MRAIMLGGVLALAATMATTALAEARSRTPAPTAKTSPAKAPPVARPSTGAKTPPRPSNSQVGHF